VSGQTSGKSPQPRIAAVLLAAGLGKRIGRAKALLEIDGRFAVHHVFDRLLEAGFDPVIAVLNPEVLRELAGDAAGWEQLGGDGRIVINPAPELGTLHSIRLGAKALPDVVDATLLMPVDHPFVRLETLRKLREAARPDKIIVPVCAGRRGHPPLFGRKHVPALFEIPLEEGARGVLHRAPEAIVELETGDDGTLRNINTAAEWERCSVQRT
jgi:molybdenum cofactor cytidylyltransferase